MRLSFAKIAIVTVVVLALAGTGVFLLIVYFTHERETPEPSPPAVSTEPRYEIIGTSVEGRKIESFTYGNSQTRILFVGGMHGGYEWNSVQLAYRAMDYLRENSDALNGISVTIIPSLNPDGVYMVTGREGRFAAHDIATDETVLASGRFNARKVDLNRNFDCKWKPTGTWRSKQVSAGSEPFSEPETEALKNFVLKNNPAAVIFWHSQANAVYASECEDGILPKTLDIMNSYARASGYSAIKSFDAYEVTGDAEGWLASIGIPAITVELKNHETTEWEANLAGMLAIFSYFKNVRAN